MVNPLHYNQTKATISIFWRRKKVTFCQMYNVNIFQSNYYIARGLIKFIISSNTSSYVGWLVNWSYNPMLSIRADFMGGWIVELHRTSHRGASCLGIRALQWPFWSFYSFLRNCFVSEVLWGDGACTWAWSIIPPVILPLTTCLLPRTSFYKGTSQLLLGDHCSHGPGRDKGTGRGCLGQDVLFPTVEFQGGPGICESLHSPDALTSATLNVK